MSDTEGPQRFQAQQIMSNRIFLPMEYGNVMLMVFH